MKKEFINGTLIDGEFYPKTGQCIVFGQNINIKDFVEGKVEVKCPWDKITENVNIV